MDNKKQFKIENFQKGQNLCIKASAGTGKTYTIRKIVAKLIKERVPITKILLVTYTEKAAGELRDRIREEMEECSTKSEDKELFIQALQDIDNATIGTIHSFCQKTLKDFAIESKVPFDMEMANDSQIETMVEHLIRDKWEKEITEKNLKVSDIQNTLVNSVKKYNGTQDLTDRFIVGLDEWAKNNEEFNKNLGILKEHPNDTFTFEKKNGEGSKTISELLRKINENLDNKKWSKINANSFGYKTIAASSHEVIAPTNYFRDLHPEYMEENEGKIFRYILEKIKEVYKAYQIQKNSNKQQSFDDIILKVQKAVLEPNSTLCQKLRDLYSYGIIDEFQDTNQAQWDIFKTIFLESDTNNLIVVGDPKQSIYSFQNADLQVYFKAISQEKLKKQTYNLTTNYRSTEEMIKACNELFKNPFFGDSEGSIEFEDSKAPEDSEDKILSPKFDGDNLKPMLILKGSINDYQQMATSKIVDFCEKNPEGNTRLQIYDKKVQKYKNINFSDIAILGRTHSELENVEKFLKDAGVPFVRYKDKNLFKGKECKNWLTLLRAINVPDFSGNHLSLLNAALISDFFRLSIKDIDTKNWEDPRNPILLLFAKWRSLEKKCRWAELQESIYKETQINNALSKSSKLQSLAKTNQIGTYIFDYLYNNQVKLHEVIRHLEGLVLKTESVEDDDENLISKGSDFDAVQLMTIHASKGLQFPIVISIAGATGVYNNAPAPYIYTEGENKIFGLEKEAKKKRQKEELAEWRRLLYVDYTRAESLLIAPLYLNWGENNDNDTKNPFAFLAQAEIKIINDANNNLVTYQEIENNQWNPTELNNRIGKVLKQNQNEFDQNAENAHQNKIQELDKSLENKSIFSFSYSSLSNHNTSEDISTNGSRENLEEETLDSSPKIIVDTHPKRIFSSSPTDSIPAIETVNGFPSGCHLGNVLHHIFENIEFTRDDNWMNESILANDSPFKKIIAEEFQKQGYDTHDKPEWVSQMGKFVFNTMNATLPEIHGATSTGNNFTLKEIPKEHRLAEMDFLLNANHSNSSLHQICKGFMDLLFERDGYYSILDWKSDIIPNYGIMNEDGDGTESIVDKRYSIQRVLYSYSLIQWLKSFGSFGQSEEEIFEKHFGGIYYVFCRGCRPGKTSGIYAQTWECYQDLENNYNLLKKVMGA